MLEVLRIETHASPTPDIAVVVMGLGLAGVMGKTNTVTWSTSPSRIVLAGSDRADLLASVRNVGAQLRSIAQNLGAGRLPPEALAPHLSLCASYALDMAVQIECQETVAWQASPHRGRAHGLESPETEPACGQPETPIQSGAATGRAPAPPKPSVPSRGCAGLRPGGRG